MAEPMKIEKVDLQLKQDTISNWKTNQTKLLKGEAGLIYADNGINPLALAFGAGKGEENLPLISIYENNQCFFPGIGAGYKLPTASQYRLGGIKINNTYFEMSGEQLQPLTLVYTTELPEIHTQHQKTEHSILTLPNNTDLTVDGDIYFESAYGDLLRVTTLQYENTTTVEAANTHLNIHYSHDEDVEVNVLDENEREGLLLHNYKSDEQNIPQNERTVAELSINNKGILLYTPDNKTVDMKHVLTMSPLITGELERGFLYVTKDANGFTVVTPQEYVESEQLGELNDLTITVNGTPFVYSPISIDPSYTNNIDLTIPTRYCASIKFDGINYVPDENNQINISSSNFTEEYKNIVENSITKIQFLGQEYTATEHLVELHDNRTWTGDDSIINVTKIGNNTTIAHDSPAGFVADESIEGSLERSFLSSNTHTFISNITRDDKGHVIKYTYSTLNIQDLLDKLTELENRVSELERNL